MHEELEAELAAGVLDRAVKAGSMELVAWLWQRGCPVSPTAVQYATFSGNVEVFRWLVIEARFRCTS